MYPSSISRVCITALAASFALTTPAAAYIGPGAGLGAIVVTIALVIGVVLLLAGLVWFPLKRMLKGKKAKDIASDSSSKTE